jgi:hypothetical protein
MKADVVSVPSTPTDEVAWHTVFRCNVCRARAEAHRLRSYVLCPSAISGKQMIVVVIGADAFGRAHECRIVRRWILE